MFYTNREYVDMILILGECRGNALEASRVYNERFHNRRQTNHNVIRRLEQRMVESGLIVPTGAPDRGRPRTVLTHQMEDDILNILENQATRSTRSIAQELGISRSTINEFGISEGYYPYHFTKVQALLPTDFPQRYNLCNWLLQRVAENNDFISKILWTDEANFSRDGFFNQHNAHYYGQENPHAAFERNHQQRFGVNVWAGILGDHLLGPVILPARLNGQHFLEFLQNRLQNLLENLPLAAIRNMWIQLDGAPAHFAAPVQDWLNEEFPDRWIGRNGPVRWSPRSPDITPLDFFLWGHIKALVYRTPVQNIQDLTNRIQNAAATVTPQMLTRVRENLVRRAQICLEVQGQHIENLL